MWFPIVALLGLAATGIVANAMVSTGSPSQPALTFLCTVNLTTGTPIDVGSVPGGDRLAIPFLGGVFHGPRLNGTIANIGGDVSRTSASGDFQPDGLLILQTDDGANILFHDEGHAPFARVSFETGAAQYSWLNTAVAVAVIAQTSVGASLAVFMVCVYACLSWTELSIC